MPGDDCDDSAPTVYAGAPELCDQLDHNCNGKADIDDGLGAGGATVEIGRSGGARALPRIAWAADKSVYGIAYQARQTAAPKDGSNAAAGDLYFEEVNLTGAVILASESINDAQSKAASNANPSLDLTWGGGAFGAAWATDSQIYVRAIGGDGSLTAPAISFSITLPSGPDLLRNSDGSQLALYASSGGLCGNLISPLGALGAQTCFAGVSQSFALAASGTGYVVAYSGDSQGGPSSGAALWSSTLVTSTPLPASWDAKIASSPSGFAVVAHPTSSSTVWQLSAFKSNGTLQCGPLALPASFVPASLAATPNGYLLVSSGAVSAQEVLADCRLGSSFPIDVGPATDVNIAGSAAGYGVVWQDTASATPKRRLFGPHYCD
jgi:Putative metal-binding motif